ncbi:MAG: tryptophan synthase subunit alpha [Actinomycetota bacterium]|nr:tryptophan synthase subunit alpha [Actinomycetota bacterium]
MTRLLEHLEKRRTDGHKLLVPYLVAGIPDRETFGEALKAVARHADVVEVGLPYSDPLMDGPVIAAAAERAITAGVGPIEALALSGRSDVGPKVAMTYYNPIHRVGEAEFCKRAAADGFWGLIVPDLPFEESGSLMDAADSEGLAWIPLVSPTSSAGRIEKIVGGATGFVYAVSTLGVTGTRAELSERAAAVVAACRAATDRPVLVGIGVSNPEQAVEASRSADGVVIGSAVVSRVVEQGAAEAEAFLSEVRTALDAGTPAPSV